MLYHALLKLSHPDIAWAGVPQDTTRFRKRVRVQLAMCSLLAGRQAPVATRVDISEQEVLRMLQHGGGGGALVAWVD